jgi:hypothetical protein
MKKIFILILLFVEISVSVSFAQISLSSDTNLVLANVDEARAILTNSDDFVRSMSPFDRSARLKTDGEVTQSEYLDFVGSNVLEWNESESQKIISAIEGIHNNIAILSLPFPKKIFIVKTTGNEEGGASYTRSNAVVFAKNDLRKPIEKIQKTFCHELFHILTRANPDLREQLYLSIGFVKCNEIAFPLNLMSRKITNPDAPINDHYIRLKVENNVCMAIPILFSIAEKYDTSRGGEFFNYLQLEFLLVEKYGNSIDVAPIYERQKPKFLDMRKAHGFFEQVGRNTKYIIHPEEILADNFAHLVL